MAVSIQGEKKSHREAVICWGISTCGVHFSKSSSQQIICSTSRHSFTSKKQIDFSKHITIPTLPRGICHLPSSAYIEQYFICKFISVYAEYTESYKGRVGEGGCGGQIHILCEIRGGSESSEKSSKSQAKLNKVYPRAALGSMWNY